jgi:hypothetical protein
VYAPHGDKEWSRSHASFPMAWLLGGEHCRIFFSARDDQNRSHLDWVEVDLSKEPWSVISEAKLPALSPGAPGTFDDSGAQGSWIVATEKALYLYYSGWNLGVTVPFRTSIGLATSIDGGLSFEKISSGPVLDRSIADPILLGSCSVLVDNTIWRMWYGSGTRWEFTPEGPRHYYNIHYAWSSNGIYWERDGTVCINFSNDLEYAIARPSVLLDDGLFRMWYSYRASAQSLEYRIGYAESRDGLSWVRKDNEVGIDVSAQGWDSEMICYPFVFQYNGNTYMLYNGNGYGKTGFGYAVLEE